MMHSTSTSMSRITSSSRSSSTCSTQHCKPRQRSVARAHQQQHAPALEELAAPQLSRRQLLLASAVAWQLAGSVAAPSATQAAAAAAAASPAAAAASCQQLQQAPNGMRWCDVVVGEGQPAIKGAFTKLDYTAKLASTGAVFDSTYQRRQPLIFKVGEHEMIEAFDVAVLGDEGLPPMREGGRRRLLVPPGPLQRQGVKSLTWVTGLLDALEEAGESITPEGSFNSELEFDIELVPKRRR